MNDVVVSIVRDPEGKLYSEVVLREKAGKPFKGSVVIDRQKGRGMDAETLTRRAEALAELLGTDLLKYIEWRCLALEAKKTCQCPECEQSRKGEE